MVCRRELAHVDTLDLYTSRLRKMFVREAAAELYRRKPHQAGPGPRARELETQQEAMIRHRVARAATGSAGDDRPERRRRWNCSETQADATYPGRLRNLRTGGRGDEQAGLLPGLRLPPAAAALAVLIQSGSAAGKTSLMEATLGFMPPEAQSADCRP